MIDFLLCVTHNTCFYFLFGIFMKPKQIRKTMKILIILFCSFAVAFVNSFSDPYLNLGASFLVAFAISGLFFGKLYLRALLSAVWLCIGIAIEFITFAAVQWYVDMYIVELMNNSSVNLYMKLLVIATTVILTMLIVSTLGRKKRAYISPQSLSLLILTPVVSIIMMYSVLYLVVQNPSHTNANKIFALTPILISIMNVFVIFVVDDKMDKNEAETAHIKAALTRTNSDSSYEDHLMDIKRIVHDFRFYINRINNLSESEKFDEYLKDINEQLTSVGIAYKYDTGNEVLDSILAETEQECLKKKITFDLSFRCDKMDFLNFTDTCAIFANAFENAINAASKLEKDAYIVADFKMIRDTFFVRIENSKTTDGNQAGAKDERLRSMHGFGKDNIKKAVEKNYGTYSVKTSDETYALTITMPRLSDDM